VDAAAGLSLLGPVGSVYRIEKATREPTGRLSDAPARRFQAVSLRVVHRNEKAPPEEAGRVGSVMASRGAGADLSVAGQGSRCVPLACHDWEERERHRLVETRAVTRTIAMCGRNTTKRGQIRAILHPNVGHARCAITIWAHAL
jgi:hypothetical protein